MLRCHAGGEKRPALLLERRFALTKGRRVAFGHLALGVVPGLKRERKQGGRDDSERANGQHPSGSVDGTVLVVVLGGQSDQRRHGARDAQNGRGKLRETRGLAGLRDHRALRLWHEGRRDAETKKQDSSEVHRSEVSRRRLALSAFNLP
eukprot:CAMPEP_0197421646 /NCGR_PEP_ID=MMETSP1170-20131217/9906_1 /TAXON_ID=54406 /ORGANISM="Sarcinochrysis sp, Strain CCMP770" /LENGTH=148 /DNA_ID=CAMNT_0042948911 /DNA_START=87 /DNA_END=529 /DNA_ORIENTATION=-